MSQIFKQRICIKNIFSAANIPMRMVQKTFSDDTTPIKIIYTWWKDFQEGRKRFEEEERTRRPPTTIDAAHVQKIKDLLLENRRLTKKKTADDKGISNISANYIWKDVFHLKRVRARSR
uniref:Mos1 transposase HTH domain-containing protein n=1 Tax=Anopheles darlingi TaxID=43151 RepID=A0A2M4CY76_ANODA